MSDKNANILRLFLLVLLFAALPYRVAGQGGYVNVTATVLDPTGVPYAGCRGTIDFVTPANATAQPTLYRGLFQKNFSISQCDSFGKFSLTLAATDQIDCGLGTLGCGQWHFSITSQDGKTGFQALLSIGPGNPNQVTNEDISSLLQAQAAPLPISNLSQFLSLNNNWTGLNSFSKQITSTVATGTAPFSIASTTVVPNLDAQLHNGLTAPASAIVGISDTQTLTAKTLTSPTINTPTITNPTITGGGSWAGSPSITSPAITTPTITNATLDGTGAAHVASQVSAATNYGTALGSQTIIASLPSTGNVSVLFHLVQVTAGVGCSAATNSVTVNAMTFTAPGGTVETANPSSNMGYTGNGAVDNGAATFGTSAFTNNGIQAVTAKSGTSLSYTTTSTLASTGCTTTPQYQIYAKVIF